jgi:formylglycine-generating enzyme required for sulfatase activity
MKKIILLTTVLVLVFSFTNKKKEFSPPGTVKINDSLYADLVEISNFGWQEYELWTKNKFGPNSKEHLNTLPDTTVWRQTGSYNEPYVQYYYRHPAYKEYPVVGVSYEQALQYCQWRTERVKEHFAKTKKYAGVEFKYKLPSKKEWELMSGNCTDLLKNAGKNEKGQIAFNHRWAKDDEEWMKDVERAGNHYSSDIFAPVFSYWPNNLKLYNMLGNVAEMVSEKGISKGGSWMNVLEECNIENDIPYSGPSAVVGFRCACVVKKEKM